MGGRVGARAGAGSPKQALGELAKQIEKILGNVFAQGFIVDRAQRTSDDSGLVVLAFLGGACAALVIVLRTA